MNLTAPTHVVFVISLILAILAVIGFLTPVPFITMNDFWFAIAGYVILALGVVLKGV